MKKINILVFLTILFTACTPTNNTSISSSTPTVISPFGSTITVIPTSSPTIRPVEFEVYNISVSPNGEMLVLTASTGLWVYRLADDKVLFHYEKEISQPYQGIFSFIAWSPDSTGLAVGKSNIGVWIWDTSTWELLTEKDGGKVRYQFPGFSWSLSSDKLVFGAGGEEILIWNKNANSWETKLSPNIKEAQVSVTWDTRGPLAIMGDYKVYDVNTGKFISNINLGGIDGGYAYIIWSPNHEYAYIFFDLGGSILNVSKNEYEFTSCCYSEVAWSMDGRYFAATPERSNEINVWDTGAQKIILQEKQGNEIYAFAWTLDGELLAAGSMNGQDVIWNTSTNHILLEIKE
jgi:WD40 repeat protein